MKKVLIAGATGYLGSHILAELIKQKYDIRTIVRNPTKLNLPSEAKVEILQAEITKVDQIVNCCENIDIVISSIGITKQQDGLTYMDVDYQVNYNLLQEAKKRGVKKFIYVSVLNGDKLKHLSICAAKEKFVQALKDSGLEYTIIRPNAFFSDMGEFLKMAKKGRVYTFGDGTLKVNPIHGADLAEVCVNSILENKTEIQAGGPQLLTHNELINIAFKVLGTKPKVTHIPDWLRVMVLKLLKIFTSVKKHGPIEFFMTVMAMDMSAPTYGKHTLEEYFTELKNHSPNRISGS